MSRFDSENLLPFKDFMKYAFENYPNMLRLIWVMFAHEKSILGYCNRLSGGINVLYSQTAKNK